MSAIYFHTKDCDDVFIHGAERALMSMYLNNMAYGVMQSIITPSFLDDEPPKIFRFIPPTHYLRLVQSPYRNFQDNFSAALNAGFTFTVDDEQIDAFPLVLNTAFRIGSDVYRLMARIHGQCEVHCYVKPENFVWFGNIIQTGLGSKIFRKDMGWEDVLSLLKKTKSPIVLSYSVCEQFPSSEIANWHDDDGDGDGWYGLSPNEQWDLGFSGLEERNKTWSLEITPDTWEGYHFGPNLSAFDLLNRV